MTSRRLLDPVARTLLDAADYIDDHGWCQGQSWDLVGQVCAGWAIYRSNRQFQLQAAARLRGHLNISDIATWNDRPGRTRDEVTAALRAAALSE